MQQLGQAAALKAAQQHKGEGRLRGKVGPEHLRVADHAAAALQAQSSAVAGRQRRWMRAQPCAPQLGSIAARRGDARQSAVCMLQGAVAHTA